MKIRHIEELCEYIARNSGFSPSVVSAVVHALGFPLIGSDRVFKELSSQFENCAEHGADCGFSGFIYYSETIAFFTANRQNIVNHMENTAAETGTDIISMVQGFGVFRNSEKPTAGEIGKALWDSAQTWPELTALYNVFAWYVLEEISHTWYRYLEDNPGYRAELSA